MSDAVDMPVLKRPILYLLAALPLLDCIIDQVNNTLHPSLGSLSLLQAINGPLLLLFLTLLIAAFLKRSANLRAVPLPVWGALLLLAIACTQELVRTGSLSMESVAPYGQMLYWVLLWAVIAVYCRRPEEANLVLKGLAWGAVATALSVLLGLMIGTTQYYHADAVVSSAGWFDTAKMITGVLLTGGVLLLYLGRGGRRWLYSLLAALCFAACFLTYARAGWVALGAVLLWFVLWMLLFSTKSRRRWLIPFLCLCLIAGVLMPAVLGTDRITARWTDVGQGEQAGSGRATFWKMAFDAYVEAPPAQQVFGRGYVAMAEMLRREYGMDIRHTHNDLFDMLTVAGLCGAAWLLLLMATLFWQVLSSSIASTEGAAAMAILLIYLLHGQLTGQLWGTGVMTYYVVASACLYTIARVGLPIRSSATRNQLPLDLALKATI